MKAEVKFLLGDEPIDANTLASELHEPAAGAEVIFDGRVRNHNEGLHVVGLEYQAYPVLALKTGTRILREEAERHGILKAIARHRTGALKIGDSAVWVGVASAHRGTAFDAARAIMERIKYELPVWKKEAYVEGHSAWVGPDQKSAETGR
jgi:molybdopterin synthase catalytic subunit